MVFKTGAHEASELRLTERAVKIGMNVLITLALTVVPALTVIMLNATLASAPRDFPAPIVNSCKKSRFFV